MWIDVATPFCQETRVADVILVVVHKFSFSFGVNNGGKAGEADGVEGTISIGLCG
jgi:hypothetical protein